MKPVVIYIDGEEMAGWTEMTLQRAKEQLTGSLDISVFMGYIPEKPVLMDAARGREVTVYVGGHLAFTGSIDLRRGTGAKKGRHHGTTENPPADKGKEGATYSLSLGPNEYTIKLTCRGKTKYLIDSSHQHPTTNMMQPKARQAAEKLVEPWGTEIEWLGTDIDLDKLRFRDGCRVVEELHRIASENCYFMYETRDGKLRITDDVGPALGEPIVLGQNILSFSCEQSEDKAKSKIKVKGQRTKKTIWGKDAVTKVYLEVEDKWVKADIPFTVDVPLTVQHYGDATPKALERRARFEANKRSAASKKVTVEVFHVQTPSGKPWDIGQLHYVEIPPEGIFDVFECTDLTYNVQNKDSVKTTLTLSPPPSGKSTVGGLDSLPDIGNEFMSIGQARRAAAGVTFAPGRYPSPWSGPSLITLPFKLLGTVFPALRTPSLLDEAEKTTPMLKLPRSLS